METKYAPDELDAQFDTYDQMKKSAEQQVVGELGQKDESEWIRSRVWDYAQAAYYQNEPDSLEETAKLADAAYYRVEKNIENPDWSEAKNRITNFVLPGHVDVQTSGEDLPDYLPGNYTSPVTMEIVAHAISLELVSE